LPQLCKELIQKPRGLILVTGPTGSGKSTTMAAMIDYLNNTLRKNVITIEDPIEYLHSKKNA
jgi:twitching motility protein PilT